MKIIAHRGNLYGPDPETENTVEQAEKCFAMGFDVELDVWRNAHILRTGHNSPEHIIPFWWLSLHRDKLFVHCKNKHAQSFLEGHVNTFMHDKEPFVKVSDGSIWLYPGTPITKKMRKAPAIVACLPELAPNWDYSYATHVCTDYPVLTKFVIERLSGKV